MFTFMARFALVRFLHETVYIHDSGPNILFIFLFNFLRVIWDRLLVTVFFFSKLTDPECSELSTWNKLWPTDRNRRTSRAGLSTSLFLPFSASFVPIEHCTDLFLDTNIPFFLLDTTHSSEIEERPCIFKFPEAAMFVCNLHMRFIVRDSARFSRG